MHGVKGTAELRDWIGIQHTNKHKSLEQNALMQVAARANWAIRGGVRRVENKTKDYGKPDDMAPKGQHGKRIDEGVQSLSNPRKPQTCFDRVI